jgi:hypothetical protein
MICQSAYFGKKYGEDRRVVDLAPIRLDLNVIIRVLSGEVAGERRISELPVSSMARG